LAAGFRTFRPYGYGRVGRILRLVSRPTPAALAFARSTLPARRVASTPMKPVVSPFANALKTAATLNNGAVFKSPTLASRTASAAGLGLQTVNAPMISAANAPAINPSGPAPMSRSEIAANADKLMNIPYVWGGNSQSGLDCSAFVSKAWGVSRHTTDNLSAVATPISKDELKTGDALNLTTARDDDGAGHVRMFDKWADPQKTRMWVYEETPPRSIHHVINWDPSYTPMRRINTIDA
jgi:cell wall-associated NlpC family hydrolase